MRVDPDPCKNWVCVAAATVESVVPLPPLPGVPRGGGAMIDASAVAVWNWAALAVAAIGEDRLRGSAVRGTEAVWASRWAVAGEMFWTGPTAVAAPIPDTPTA